MGKGQALKQTMQTLAYLAILMFHSGHKNFM